MRYFIYSDIEITEVGANTYEFWHEQNSENFKLPDFEITVEETVYSMETMYHGAIDKDEDILPFVIFYFEDNLVLTEEGIKREYFRDEIFYFKTFEEMHEKYSEIVVTLSAKI